MAASDINVKIQAVVTGISSQGVNVIVFQDAKFYAERARFHGTMVDYYHKGLVAPVTHPAMLNHYADQLYVEARTAFHFAQLLNDEQVAEERDYQSEFTRDHWAV